MKCIKCDCPLCEIDMIENPNFCLRCWNIATSGNDYSVKIVPKDVVSVNDTIWENKPEI